jgi:hypothetical protein
MSWWVKKVMLEGYVGVEVKDNFLLLISHGFTLIVTDFFIIYKSFELWFYAKIQ